MKFRKLREKSGSPFGSGGLFEEGNIGKKQRNHSKSEGYLSSNINIGEVNSILNVLHIPPIFLKWNATTKNRIPKSKFVVNTHNLSFDCGSVRGTIIAAPNHPADRFTNKSDNVMNKIGSIFDIKTNSIKMQIPCQI